MTIQSKMSAQYLLNFGNETVGPVEILSDSELAGETPLTDDETQTKQKEAMYYIVAVITFYALTFLILFCKFARFKKKELDDTVPYFPLPPDSKMAAKMESENMALRKYGSRDNYGSSDVTPKVMRAKIVPHWLCRRETTKACDV